MVGRLKDMTINRDGTQNITVTVADDFSRAFDALREHEIEVEITRKKRKRTLSANDFCWALCSDIGKAMSPPLSKDEVYRMAIKAVGVYTPYPLKAEDVETVQRRWNSHGTGWFIEIVDDSKLEGYKKIHMYYGSSTYTVEEMRVLIDWLVDQAEQMEIPIPISRKREEELLRQWGRKREKDEEHSPEG